MQSLAGSTGILRRHRVVSVFSALHRWWHPALVRGDAPLIYAASALRSEGDPTNSRFAYEPMQDHTILKGNKWHTRGYMTNEVALGETQRTVVEGDRHIIKRRANKEVTESNPTSRGIKEVTDIPITSPVRDAVILPKSSHRDGTIYKERLYWKQNYFVDITDRNETLVDPMRYSVSTDCNPDPENCMYHFTCEMAQIFSLKLAKVPMKSGSIQLYGYIAARDDVDSMLNYVFHRTRDDPIIIHQGSLIEMTGPKRGIALISDVLFEFDMRIKNGDQEEDDLQLIDGVTEFHEVQMRWTPFTVRLNGEYGAVDMCIANVCNAVEATVEIAILDVQNGFDLSLSSELSMLEVREEIQLFCGTICRPCGLRRFVMAVLLDTVMHLKFKVDQKGSNIVEYCCSFEAKLHGSASHQIKLELAYILVKVTWSTLME